MSENSVAGRHKEIVVRCYRELAEGRTDFIRAALRGDFVEHSPGNPSGRDAFIEFMVNAPVAESRVDIKRVVADERYVAVHYRMIPPGGERDLAVIDIWHLENDQITEHWDVVQPVPAPEEIPRGMF